MKSADQIKEKLEKEYLNVLFASYKLWPAVQLVNFYLVPLQYQVLTVQCVALAWSAYLSLLVNSTHHEVDEKVEDVKAE